jgi:chaperonin GroEL
VVAGGGVTLIRAAEYVRALIEGKASGEFGEEELKDSEVPTGDDETAGFNLVLRACVVKNGGQSGAVAVDKLKNLTDEDVGLDVTDFEWKNMFDAGIIDPVKIVRNAITNAVSIASTMLTTEAATRKEGPQGAAAHNHP